MVYELLKITLRQAAVRLRRIPRMEFNQSIIRSLTPQQAAGNALAIAVKKNANSDEKNYLIMETDDYLSLGGICESGLC